MISRRLQADYPSFNTYSPVSPFYFPIHFDSVYPFILIATPLPVDSPIPRHVVNKLCIFNLADPLVLDVVCIGVYVNYIFVSSHLYLNAVMRSKMITDSY